jgi:hypothetical protein
MKLFAAAKAALSQHARTFASGGPVGVYYARKLARINRRLARVSVYIQRENDLHREHLRTLNWELNELVKEQQAANAAARQFWKAPSQAGAQS